MDYLMAVFSKFINFFQNEFLSVLYATYETNFKSRIMQVLQFKH